jgi:hypothetical protein
MMPNLDKCMFGVSSGKLLRYLVSQRGIEANPKRVKAIEDMQSPHSHKEVQKLARINDGSPKSIRIQVRRTRYAIL